MAKSKSKKTVYDELDKKRKPRVQVTYEVESEEEGIEKRELPLVVGVLGDFSGDAKKKALKKSKFVEINQENMSNVIKKIAPTLSFRVKSTLDEDKKEDMAVNLKFESMQDFSPDNIVKQVKPLKKLLEARDKLNELSTKVDISDDLSEVLAEVLKNTDNIEELARELNITTDEESRDDEVEDDDVSTDEESGDDEVEDEDVSTDEESGDDEVEDDDVSTDEESGDDEVEDEDTRERVKGIGSRGKIESDGQEELVEGD